MVEQIDMFARELEVAREKPAPRILVGKVQDVCPTLQASSFDAVLCDPPYGLSFMGKGWDHSVPSPELWREVLRVAKPGTFLMAFGGTRLFHRTVCGIEDAGFEVRDTIAWMYGTGFPKSHSLEKSTGAPEWQGYGTALKPAYEPVCLAQKPREGTYAHNALEHGCGGLAIDASRIEVSGVRKALEGTAIGYGASVGSSRAIGTTTQGRWPANVILDAEAGAVLDAQSGGASRFFYCPKASRAEREAGLEHFGEATVSDGRDTPNDTAYQRGKTKRKNTHPTVKPIDLIRYLARLILPPPREDGEPRRILVPFSGSGSEVIGCMLAGWDEVVGIEMNPEYAEIARARIEHWRKEVK